MPHPKAVMAKMRSRFSKNRDGGASIHEDPDIADTLPSPTTAAVEQQERWNETPLNVYRTLAAFWGFIIMGANDAVLGALIPYVGASFVML